MPCTLSTQKRAHLAQAPTPMFVNWASLPFDQVRSVGDCLLADNDIDDYMAFRAVCHDWRSATKGDPEKAKAGDDTDPAARFIPTKWALLDRRDDLVMLVNVDTGRFLCKRTPLLRQFHFIGATSGALILLGESTAPYRARVLNPFTGSIAYFEVSVPCARVMAVAVITKPTLTVFISTEIIGEIVWADQSMESFKSFSMDYPNKPTCITSFGGNLYATDRYGSIYLSTVHADVVTAAIGEPRHPSAADISMDAISPILDTVATIGHRALMSGRFYLVEFAGDLLLVTKPTGFTNDQPMVRRVNTDTLVLEPVSSIGSRALFVSHVKCLSINANKFPSIQGGYVYFLESTGSYCYNTIDTTIVRVADNTVVKFDGAWGSLLEGFIRPFTLTQVIANYCKSIHYSKLYKTMVIDKWGIWDDYTYDDSESDESSSYELDDEESSSSEHNDDEASTSEPAEKIE